MRCVRQGSEKHRSRRGNVLILVLIAVLVIAQLFASALSQNMSARRFVEVRGQKMDMLYLAEGAREAAIAELRQQMANLTIEMIIEKYPAVGDIVTTFQPSSSLPAGATARSVFNELVAGDELIADPDGLPVRVKTYLLTTTVTHPLAGVEPTIINQIVVRRLLAAFHHSVFYDDDLEILPGPNMTFKGRVHSNKDIYLGANNTLRLDTEYLHTAGNIYDRRKDTGAQTAGDVEIRVKGTGTYVDMNGLDSSNVNWTTASQTRWQGTVQTGVHGVTKIAAPEVGSIQPGGTFDADSTVHVVNGTIEKDGFTLVEGVHIPLGTVQTSIVYDKREKKNVTMTDIDLKKLAGYKEGDPDGTPSFSNQLPANGLVYATRTDAGANMPGIRLKNGARIDSSVGLTVVSNDPVYIQGDFNSVNHKPVAVVCDAVNIFSNAWDDSNSNKVIANRKATSTTVDCAFIAGIKTTTAGDYNGGMENYPRFHEDWGGKTLTYAGAFLALWNSQIAVGKWQDASYSPPTRVWSYDESFLGAGGLPPFTPAVIEIRKGAWWQN